MMWGYPYFGSMMAWMAIWSVVWLVVVGVLSSAIAAFFYARVIVLMFFSDPVPDGPEVVVPNVFSGVAVGVGVAATVVFGIAPEPLLALANHAANHLFVS